MMEIGTLRSETNMTPAKAAIISVCVMTLIGGCTDGQKYGAMLTLIAWPAMLANALSPAKAPDPKCLNEPPFTLPEPLYVDSVAVLHWKGINWLQGNDFEVGGLQFPSMAKALIASKLSYLELQAPNDRELKYLIAEFSELAGGHDARFLRVSIQKRGMPSCSTYEDIWQRNRSIPSAMKNAGLTDDWCVATEVIDKPNSRYALDVEKQSKLSFYTSDILENWQILDTTTKTVYASARRHDERNISCPLAADRLRFKQLIRSNGVR